VFENKYVIGLTGRMGRGKSTVSKILSENNDVEVVDADKIAADIMKKDGLAYPKVLLKFENIIILDSNGEINRKSLENMFFLTIRH